MGVGGGLGWGFRILRTHVSDLLFPPRHDAGIAGCSRAERDPFLPFTNTVSLPAPIPHHTPQASLYAAVGMVE